MALTLGEVLPKGHELFFEIQYSRLGAIGNTGINSLFAEYENVLSRNSLRNISECPQWEYNRRFFNILAELFLRCGAQKAALSMKADEATHITRCVSSLIKIIAFANLFLPELKNTALEKNSHLNLPSFSLLLWHKNYVQIMNREQKITLHERIRSLIMYILHGECSQAARYLYLILDEICQHSAKKFKNTLFSCLSAISLVLESFPGDISNYDSSTEGQLYWISKFRRSIKQWQDSLQKIEITLDRILNNILSILRKEAQEKEEEYSPTISIIKKIFTVFGGKDKEALLEIVQYAGLDQDHYWLFCGHFIYFGREEALTEISFSSRSFIVNADMPALASSNYEGGLEKFRKEYKLQHSMEYASNENIDVVCLDKIAEYRSPGMNIGTLQEDFVIHVLNVILDWFCSFCKLAATPGTERITCSRTLRTRIDSRLKSRGLLKRNMGLDVPQEQCYNFLIWMIVHWTSVIINPFSPQNIEFSEIYDSIVLEHLRLTHKTATQFSPSKFGYYCTYLLCTPTMNKVGVFEEIAFDMYEELHDDSNALFRCISLLICCFGCHSEIQSFICDQYKKLLPSTHKQIESLSVKLSKGVSVTIERVLILHISKHVLLGEPKQLYTVITKYFEIMATIRGTPLDSLYLLLGVIGAIHDHTRDPELIFHEVFCTNLTKNVLIPPDFACSTEALCRIFIGTLGAFWCNQCPLILSRIEDSSFIQLCKGAYLLEKKVLDFKLSINPDGENLSLFEEYVMSTCHSHGISDDCSLANHAQVVLSNEFVPLLYRLSLLKKLVKIINVDIEVKNAYPTLSAVLSFTQRLLLPRTCMRDSIS